MIISNIILLILSTAVTDRRDKSILYNRVSLIILFYSILSSLVTLNSKCLDNGIALYNGLFYSTSISSYFQIFVYILCILILQLNSFYPRKFFSYDNYNVFIKKYLHISINSFNKIGEHYKIVEYPLIILFIVIGANFLMSSNDLISVFIAIELQSYGLYLLCCLYRNSESSTAAGLTYFLLGGLSSCFILLGIALIYVNTGTTNLENFYVINSLYNNANYLTIDNYNINYLNVSLVVMAVGFLFKIGAAPFHFWSPDVYDGIPTVVTTFVTIIGKISILIFILELISYTNESTNGLSWTLCLLLSSLLSLIIGTVLGLNEPRIKRLLAYSTISHLGFMLLALSVNSIESIQAFIFYILQYSISNLNIFLLVIIIGYNFYTLVVKSKEVNNKNKYIDNNKNYDSMEINNSPLQLITQLKGYFFLNPIISMSLCITIYSFVGIPPLVGFFAKQMVLSAALDNGYVFISYVAILVSVISAVYYLNMIRQMFFETSEMEVDNNLSVDNGDNKYDVDSSNILINSSLTVSTSIITLIIALFFVSPNEWLSMTNILSLTLFNT